MRLALGSWCWNKRASIGSPKRQQALIGLFGATPARWALAAT